jgi:hypothetical protein
LFLAGIDGLDRAHIPHSRAWEKTRDMRQSMTKSEDNKIIDVKRNQIGRISKKGRKRRQAQIATAHHTRLSFFQVRIERQGVGFFLVSGAAGASQPALDTK